MYIYIYIRFKTITVRIPVHLRYSAADDDQAIREGRCLGILPIFVSLERNALVVCAVLYHVCVAVREYEYVTYLSCMYVWRCASMCMQRIYRVCMCGDARVYVCNVSITYVCVAVREYVYVTYLSCMYVRQCVSMRM